MKTGQVPVRALLNTLIQNTGNAGNARMIYTPVERDFVHDLPEIRAITIASVIEELTAGAESPDTPAVFYITDAHPERTLGIKVKLGTAETHVFPVVPCEHEDSHSLILASPLPDVPPHGPDVMADMPVFTPALGPVIVPPAGVSSHDLSAKKANSQGVIPGAKPEPVPFLGTMRPEPAPP
jgi:hypothetical protein